jgi:4-amino-4-deoxy-L-arabinose transferase-like glycosyltransferase
MRLKHDWWLFAPILILALTHGGLYASLMPPWGLIDEEQHLHYIQFLAEEWAIPRVGQTTLSPEIIDSAFKTRRWEHFHWPAPAYPAPQYMGLEGQSYEGYQPPLYYLLLAPFFSILQGDILEKLYALRWISLLLSLLTLVIVFRLGRRLFPGQPAIAYLSCLLLALLPERTAAVGRVNNDTGVEVAAAALIWACTAGVLDRLSWRNSLLLGALFGVSFLFKTSASVLLVPIALTFWMNRSSPSLLKYLMGSAGISAALIVPWVARSLLLYGDLTGFSSFQKMTNFAAPTFNASRLIAAVWDAFRHVWLVWWKGGRAESNVIVSVLIFALLLASVVAGMNLWRDTRADRRDYLRNDVISIYAVSIAVCAFAVVASYFAGAVPVIQGRFFMPVLAPVVLLLAAGIWRSTPRMLWAAGTLGALLLMSLSSLFGNLLPFHYYWSAFVNPGGHPLVEHAALDTAARWQLFLSRLLNDKPETIRALLPWLLGAFGISLASIPLGCATFPRLKRGGMQLLEDRN